jgi:hypothetical protein
MRIIRCGLALVALILVQIPLARAAEQVDLLLVLASDVSRSIVHPKFLLQREGYAAAMSNSQVLDAIQSGPHGKIAICFVEWSGFAAQKVALYGSASAKNCTSGLYLSRSAAGGVGCSTETGSDAGKVFFRASSSAFSRRQYSWLPRSFSS